MTPFKTIQRHLSITVLINVNKAISTPFLPCRHQHKHMRNESRKSSMEKVCNYSSRRPRMLICWWLESYIVTEDFSYYLMRPLQFKSFPNWYWHSFHVKQEKHLLSLRETLMFNQRHNFCIYCSAVHTYFQTTVWTDYSMRLKPTKIKFLKCWHRNKTWNFCVRCMVTQWEKPM